MSGRRHRHRHRHGGHGRSHLPHSAHPHGNLVPGYIIVIVSWLALGWADLLLLFATPPDSRSLLGTIGLLGAFAFITLGVIGMCRRESWGRVIVMTPLWICAMFAMFGVFVVSAEKSDLPPGAAWKITTASVIYLVVSPVLTYSHFVHRLTSRAWD